MSLYSETLALAVKYRSLADRHDADYLHNASANNPDTSPAIELHEMADQLVALAGEIQSLEMADDEKVT